MLTDDVNDWADVVSTIDVKKTLRLKEKTLKNVKKRDKNENTFVNVE